MKKSFSRQKFIYSKIPCSKSNKLNLGLSTKGLGRKNKNDSIYKETVDGSCTDTQTFAFNHDSLNSKGTINKNNSLGRFDNKLIFFSSSIKNDFEMNNKLLKFSKKYKFNSSAEFLNEIFSCCEDDSNIIIKKDNNNEIKENESEQEDTNRIDYRYYPKIPEIESNKKNKYFWLATYDKLMKKSKILKILDYYTEDTPKKNDKILIEKEKKENREKSEKYNFLEKSIIIEGYEIYFLQKFNKPFIRPKKGGKIFLKLYLLNTEQINKIFSYINRLEYKHYINKLETIKEKNYFKIISKSNKTIYNYSTIFCIGTFVNINIFLFSHIEKIKNKSNFDINDFPSPNKLAKLIKILLINFPDYSKEYFIDYLLKSIQNNYELNNTDKELLIQKRQEINSLLISNNKKSLRMPNRNNNNTNSIIKNVIQKIPTNTLSSNKTSDEFYIFNENIFNSLNHLEKSNLNNKNDDEIKNFDFRNNFKTRISIKQQKSEKNFKKIDMNRLINKKVSGLNIARNSEKINMNTYFTNRLQNNDAINKKKDNVADSIRSTKLIEPIKKSLTRYNTNKTYIHYKKINKKNNQSGKILNRFTKMKLNKENKENNMNIYNNDRYSSICNYIKTDLNKNNKNTRNKNNLNPFNLTITNNGNKNDNDQKTLNKNFKTHIKVLSTIRKVISQKINNITENTNSINVKNLNMNNSNSSFICNKFNYINNIEQNNNTNINYDKLVCKTNNNSKNKNSEYVTPRKKKLYYYYN